MLYSNTNMETVGVKGLTSKAVSTNVEITHTVRFKTDPPATKEAHRHPNRLSRHHSKTGSRRLAVRMLSWRDVRDWQTLLGQVMRRLTMNTTEHHDAKLEQHWLNAFVQPDGSSSSNSWRHNTVNRKWTSL